MWISSNRIQLTYSFSFEDTIYTWTSKCAKLITVRKIIMESTGVPFCVELPSQSIMSQSNIRDVASTPTRSLLFTVEFSSVVWIYQFFCVCFSILLLMDTWAVFSLGLLWIKPLWTFLSRSFSEHVFLSLDMEWLGCHCTFSFMFFKNCQNFSQRGCIIYFPTKN